MAPSVGHVLHRVCQRDNGSFRLDVGEAFGVAAGAKFEVYASDDLNSRCLGSLVVRETTAFSTDLLLSPGTSPFTLASQSGYALQVWAPDTYNLRVYVADDGELLRASKLVKKEMDKSQLIGKRSILLVKQDDAPNISLTMEGDQVIFNINDQSCIDHGMTRMYKSVTCKVNDLLPVLAGAVDFFWHLNRTSSNPSLTNSNSVTLQCSRLEENGLSDMGVEVLTARDEILQVHGSIHVVTDEDLPHGFQVTNNTAVPLYVGLFLFDMSDLSISKSLT